jgi:hypothetical protein
MKQNTAPRYYSVKCYPSEGFPMFMDLFKTLEHARRAAMQALKDGFHLAEILQENPDRIGIFGIERDLVETVQ